MSNHILSQPGSPAKVTRRQLLASLSALALLSIGNISVPAAAAAENITDNVSNIHFTRDAAGHVHFSPALESWLTQLHQLTATLIEFGALLTAYQHPDPNYQPQDIDLLTLAFQVRDELNEMEYRLGHLDFDSLIQATTGRYPWAVHIEHAIVTGGRIADIQAEIDYLASIGEVAEAERLLRLLVKRRVTA